MSKKYFIALIVLILLGGLAGFYAYSKKSTEKLDQGVSNPAIEQREYNEIGKDIAERLDDVSPTPPTSKDWKLVSLDFAKGTNLVYVTYHDHSSVQRMLLGVDKVSGQYQYEVLATFNLAAEGDWQLSNGSDLGSGKELIFKDYLSK